MEWKCRDITTCLWIILKQKSKEAHIYMRRYQGVKCTHFDVSNMIYHKFSHGATSYTLNGENVNVMLELQIIPINAPALINAPHPHTYFPKNVI